MKTLLIIIGSVIALILILILVIVLSVVIFARKNLGSLSLAAKHIRDATEEAEHTPRSLSGVESIHLREIKKDFPEFDSGLVKSYIKSFAKLYFAAVSGEKADMSALEDCCSRQFMDYIISHSSEGESFKGVKIHKVVISDYRKTNYDANIIFELAVEYRRGNRSAVSQEKYEAVYTYFLEDGVHEELSSMKCPNCGAPIESVKRDFCPYCDHRLDIHEEAIVIDRTWKVTDMRKSD